MPDKQQVKELSPEADLNVGLTHEPGNKLEPERLSDSDKNYSTDYPLPPGLLKKFIVENGNFFSKDDPKSPVFKDVGKSLSTSTNDKEVIASMVLVAQSKNWTELKLSGTKEFRQTAWLEAESLGLKTRGYTPSDKDIALLNDLKERRSINKIEGKEQLLDHDMKGERESAKQDGLAKLTDAGNRYQQVFDAAPPLVQASIEASRQILNKQIDAAVPDTVRATVNDRFNKNMASIVEKGDFKGFPPPLVEEKIKANIPSKEAEKEKSR